jgi:hypothetical protein
MVMKKSFITYLLVFQFLMPTLAPWFPHGALHAIHDQHQSHHAENTHADKFDLQDRAKRGHGQLAHIGDHHPVNLDTVTYFNDYLHADLQAPAPVTLVAPAHDYHDFDFDPAFGLSTQQRYELASIKIHAPPDRRAFEPNQLPLYLSTQRLRI